MSSKKYQGDVSQNGATWSARIMRQVTSRKSIISKQQGNFDSEAEAQSWVEKNLAEFISIQKNTNSRQGNNRKDQLEMKRLRSSRRAEKTASSKREKEAMTLANQTGNKPLDSNDDFDSDFTSSD